jgi:hypothetical protein
VRAREGVVLSPLESNSMPAEQRLERPRFEQKCSDQLLEACADCALSRARAGPGVASPWAHLQPKRRAPAFTACKPRARHGADRERCFLTSAVPAHRYLLPIPMLASTRLVATAADCSSLLAARRAVHTRACAHGEIDARSDSQRHAKQLGVTCAHGALISRRHVEATVEN